MPERISMRAGHKLTHNQSTQVYKAEVLFITLHEDNLYLKISRDLEIKIHILKMLHFVILIITQTQTITNISKNIIKTFIPEKK